MKKASIFLMMGLVVLLSSCTIRVNKIQPSKNIVKKEFRQDAFDKLDLHAVAHVHLVQAEGDSRVVLQLPPVLAPVKAAILPLVKKDGLPEKAREIMDSLKFDFKCVYDEKDSIGKRYRRQDAVGTPFCITVDHDTLNDNCVTVRYRDSMKQDRVKIEDLHALIDAQVNMKNLFKKLIG